MAGYNGSSLEIRTGAGTPVRVAAVKGKTVNMNREMVDVTTDDSLGWKSYLPRPGTRGLEIKIEGVITTGTNAYWEGLIMATTFDTTMRVYLPSGSYLTCAEGFCASGIELKGQADGSVEVSGSLMSSGVVTLT